MKKEEYSLDKMWQKSGGAGKCPVPPTPEQYLAKGLWVGKIVGRLKAQRSSP